MLDQRLLFSDNSSTSSFPNIHISMQSYIFKVELHLNSKNILEYVKIKIKKVEVKTLGVYIHHTEPGCSFHANHKSFI